MQAWVVAVVALLLAIVQPWPCCIMSLEISFLDFKIVSFLAVLDLAELLWKANVIDFTMQSNRMCISWESFICKGQQFNSYLYRKMGFIGSWNGVQGAFTSQDLAAVHSWLYSSPFLVSNSVCTSGHKHWWALCSVQQRGLPVPVPVSLCPPAALISHMIIPEPGTKPRKYNVAIAWGQSGPSLGAGIPPKPQDLHVGEGWFPKGLYQCQGTLSQEQDKKKS